METHSVRRRLRFDAAKQNRLILEMNEEQRKVREAAASPGK
jgi:hypothetical protein